MLLLEEEKKYNNMNTVEQIQYDHQKKIEYLKTTAILHIVELAEYIRNIENIRSYEVEQKYPRWPKLIAPFYGKNYY